MRLLQRLRLRSGTQIWLSSESRCKRRNQPIAEPEELGNAGRIQWVSGRPGEAPAYAGTDFIIARDGRIAALYLFFDKLRCAGLCCATSYAWRSSPRPRTERLLQQHRRSLGTT